MVSQDQIISEYRSNLAVLLNEVRHDISRARARANLADLSEAYFIAHQIKRQAKYVKTLVK